MNHPRFCLPPGDPRTHLLDAQGREVTPSWFEIVDGVLMFGRYVATPEGWVEEMRRPWEP